MSAEEPETLRRIRYLAPNAITALSLVFGMLSLVAAHRGDWALSAWLIIYAVLTDRVDGLVARRLHASSAFGMQLDSFADFLNFGLAPAFLLYAYLTARPDLAYADGGAAHVLLGLACANWVCCAVFRLARYNVQAEDAPPTKIFFGIPSTMAGGLIAIWFLVGIKYAQPGVTFGGPKIFGDATVVPREFWLYSPIALVILGWAMASSLPMPKGPPGANKFVFGFVGLGIAAGYVLGFARLLPDVAALLPTGWLLVFLIWGQVSSTGRGLQPPQLFPIPTRPPKSK